MFCHSKQKSPGNYVIIKCQMLRTQLVCEKGQAKFKTKPRVYCAQYFQIPTYLKSTLIYLQLSSVTIKTTWNHCHIGTWYLRQFESMFPGSSLLILGSRRNYFLLTLKWALCFSSTLVIRGKTNKIHNKYWNIFIKVAKILLEILYSFVN